MLAARFEYMTGFVILLNMITIGLEAVAEAAVQAES